MRYFFNLCQIWKSTCPWSLAFFFIPFIIWGIVLVWLCRRVFPLIEWLMCASDPSMIFQYSPRAWAKLSPKDIFSCERGTLIMRHLIPTYRFHSRNIKSNIWAVNFLFQNRLFFVVLVSFFIWAINSISIFVKIIIFFTLLVFYLILF